MQKVNEEAAKINKNQKVLIQVNTSHEETKSGIKPDETVEFIQQIKDLKNIEICGFMTIGPLTDEESEIKKSFLDLKKVKENCQSLFSDLNLKHLSMGMTNDYKLAIECGSSMIRVGRRIFGSRA
jgi:pyridoxal phosphate enzyme (YggS family)